MKEDPFDVVKKYRNQADCGEPSSRIDDDPALPQEVWLPVFHEWRCKLAPYPPDYIFLCEHKPEHYRKLKQIEQRVNGLREARLSEVLAAVREWRWALLEATGK
jgi:hypothetical protein